MTVKINNIFVGEIHKLQDGKFAYSTFYDTRTLIGTYKTKEIAKQSLLDNLHETLTVLMKAYRIY